MSRRPLSFPPPRLLPPAVHAALARAIEDHARVVIHVRGSANSGLPDGKVEGVPERATPARNGKPRIAVALKDGSTQQLLLVEHIIAVTAHSR